ncbi:MAG: hypothetical protein EZS28_022529, partial [Streblomastix strix]
EAKGIIHINYDNSQLIASNCIFSNIQIQSKGGNAIRILNNGPQPIISNIKECQFNNISSIGDSNGRGGSAIYMENKHGSKVIIEESCQFYECIIEKGNGGAIYIEIDFTSQFEFKISDALIQECQTKSDTTKDLPPTGYGGGIFLTGNGEYDPSTKRLDLKGMKIYGNSADKSGQSLYVAMIKLAEWCRNGNAGEYVKGNYSDGISNQNELQGIQDDQTTFKYYSSILINEHQNQLDEFWNVASPRIFRNYSVDSTQLSTILIKSVGRFNITGKAVFYLINFIMESTGYQEIPGIYGLSPTAEIDLKDCQFHMQNAGSQIGKCFVRLNYGGNHMISNLNSKNISSEENIVKVNFANPGSLSISNSQFDNITKIGSYTIGGVINAILTYESNRLDITNCQFTTCKAQDTWGGAVYAEIQNLNAQIILTCTQIIQCEAQKGGGLHIKSSTTGQVILDNLCEFKQCVATSGNGGGIYADLEYSTTEQSLFLIKDVLIQDCHALLSPNAIISTGFGGGIFIGVRGTYNSSAQSLNLKGMKIYGNSAISGGQSLYVVMSQLKEWCEYGLLGEYAKGNYSDTDSDENELQGLPIDFSQFASSSQSYIQANEKTLENYWGIKIPSYSIWHVQQRFGQQNGTNAKNCGEINSPCQTIEYAI